MTQPMETSFFDKLQREDFQNGAIRDGIRAALKERDELRAVVAKLPKTADGVVVTDDMTVFCPRGHAAPASNFKGRIYCCEGDCWDDGCQSDSGSGTSYSFAKCYSTEALATSAKADADGGERGQT